MVLEVVVDPEDFEEGNLWLFSLIKHQTNVYFFFRGGPGGPPGRGGPMMRGRGGPRGAPRGRFAPGGEGAPGMLIM